MIFDFFKNKHICNHKNVPIDVEECYCPDCGELIKNEWYIIRCACCNIKRESHLEYDNIKPNSKFCHNCGSTDFIIEKIESLNCVTSRFAIVKKIIVKQQFSSIHQIWIENEDNIHNSIKIPKLQLLH